jgi:NhaP-type Na+/H+ or K+/H+ antiporter
MKDSWAFGSLISTTDPVAVLAIFKQMDIDENLFAIVFGESIFNDAIGIVMYDSVKSMGNDENMSTFQEILTAIKRFLIIFIGSIVIGAIIALIVAFI